MGESSLFGVHRLHPIPAFPPWVVLANSSWSHVDVMTHPPWLSGAESRERMCWATNFIDVSFILNFEGWTVSTDVRNEGANVAEASEHGRAACATVSRTGRPRQQT